MHRLHGHVFCGVFILSHLLQLNGGLSNLVDWEAGRRISGSIGFVFFRVVNSSMPLKTASLAFLFCTCSCWSVGQCHALDLVLWNNLSWELDIIDVSGVEECFSPFFSLWFPPFLFLSDIWFCEILILVIVGSLGLHLLRVCYLEETMGCQRCTIS